MTTDERIHRINQVLEDYFKHNPNKVQAKELMPLFIKNGIFEKDDKNRPGLPIRTLLRKLDKGNDLKRIPYIVAERKDKNTNWFFAPTNKSLHSNSAHKEKNIEKNTMPKELVKVIKNHNTDLKSGLEPWVGGEPKVLILGSLPGDESIKQQAYYANKRNAFWKIMRALYNNNIETDNKKFIISCGIALWDCVHSAIRKGSLDSAIKDDSVVANDIRGLIAKYPTINTIILNGGKAEKYYNKYCKGIDCKTIRRISTSPAATRVFEEKLQEWSIVKDMTK